MSYRYYEFEEPCKCLMIATAADTVVLEYQEHVANIQDGVAVEEISVQDFLEKLAVAGTADIPTIERGIKNAAIDVQEALFQLASTGEEAIVLTRTYEFI